MPYDIISFSHGTHVTGTVLGQETGGSAKTDLATGKFSIGHMANKDGESWTLRAGVYGYYSKEIDVFLGEDGEVNKTIILDLIPKGQIVGQVLDRYYKNPAANAVIKIKDNPNIESVVAGEEDRLIIEGAYGGEHVLKIIADGFEPGEAKIRVVGNIVGDKAFDIRYLNNNEDAQLKLIEWYSRGEDIYIKLSANLIVNIRGEEVGIEKLPNALTYYDANGNMVVYVK